MKKNVDYYISKGFDKKTAEYFTEGRKKSIRVVPNNDYKLLITFDNKETRLFDVKPFIKKGTVFYALNDIKIFNNCYIDSNNSVCWDKNPNIDSEKQWSNKIDIGADNCYLESVPVFQK